MVDGDWVHVAGTTGFDYATMTISDDVVQQAEQCPRNVEAALAEAKCTFADVVRVRYLLPSTYLRFAAQVGWAVRVDSRLSGSSPSD